MHDFRDEKWSVNIMKTNGNSVGKLIGAAFVLCLLVALIPTTGAAVPDNGYIEVGTVPVPDFVGTPLRGSAPLTVAFTDQSAGARMNMTYNWSFGDGTYSNTPGSVSHTYTREGNYTVSLTLRNDFGTVTETKTNYVVVGSGPVANFTADSPFRTTPGTVRFTDQSAGNPTTWRWDFGDGTTSTERNPVHNYSNYGIYNVSLTVTNSFGTDTTTKTSYVNIHVAPYVFFTANSTCENPRQVVFETHGRVTQPANYTWNFGDGTTSSQQNPAHSYASAGVYDVTLTVRDQYTSANYTMSNLIVNDKVRAEFTATNHMGSSPLRVQFTDQSVGSSNFTYLWNFGDGTTSTDRNPSHSYNATGTYTVALTVIAPCGVDSIVKENYVSVGRTPVADFIGTPTNGRANLSVQFTDRSQGENLTYNWNFGDGTTSAARNPTHVYTQSGTYTVSLTVSNAYGNNTATKTQYITVGAAPRADFRADVLTGTAPHHVRFTDLSAGNPTSWYWDFGDGHTSREANPNHTYNRSGYYNVTLTVGNEYGESTLLREGGGQRVYLEDTARNTTPIMNNTNIVRNTTNNMTNNTTNPGNNTTNPISSIPGPGALFAVAAILGLVGVGAYFRKDKK